MRSHKFVIAHHKESLDWVENLPDQYCIVTSGGCGSIGLECDNVGREAYKYLFWIVHNWEDLPDHVTFLQANPFPHGFNWSVNTASDFSTIGGGSTLRHDSNSAHDSWALSLAAELFRDLTFLPLWWSFGAQFTVCKELITHRPKAWYQYLLSIAADDFRFPWAAERLWPALVGPCTPLTRDSYLPLSGMELNLFSTVTGSHSPLLHEMNTSLAACNSACGHVFNIGGGGNFETEKWLEAQKRKMELVYKTSYHMANPVLWSDVDVIFFMGWEKELMHNLAGLDIVFQAESLSNRLPNCGFFAFNPSIRVSRFFARVLEHDFSAGFNDQDCITGLLPTSGLRWGLLPPTFGATSHMWPNPIVRNLKTFHANCATNVEQKLRLIRSVLSVRSRSNYTYDIQR